MSSDYTSEGFEVLDDHFDVCFPEPGFSQHDFLPDIYSFLPDPVIPNGDDPIVFCSDVSQARNVLRDTFNIDYRALSSSNINGCVILRIQDFTKIRGSTESHPRLIPMIIYLPPPGMENLHPELNELAQNLQGFAHQLKK